MGITLGSLCSHFSNFNGDSSSWINAAIGHSVREYFTILYFKKT